MLFFTGIHQPAWANRITRPFISINRIRGRRSGFEVGEWILDSGAFTELSLFGAYRHEPEEYAAEVERWRSNGTLLAAVSQDFMCEPFMLDRTGLGGVQAHQSFTIQRYEIIRRNTAAYVMPVLQGYTPAEYVAHVRQYGTLLAVGAWVGVGSVCKRQASPEAIVAVLAAIKRERPDLRLHGFGVKISSLKHPVIRMLLHSADSMAWSKRACWEAWEQRQRGEVPTTGGNSLAAALAFGRQIEDERCLFDL